MERLSVSPVTALLILLEGSQMECLGAVWRREFGCWNLTTALAWHGEREVLWSERGCHQFGPWRVAEGRILTYNAKTLCS